VKFNLAKNNSRVCITIIIFCGSTPRKAEGNMPSVKAAVLLNTTKKPSKREDKNTGNVRIT
jgi:hypothetical protein